MKKGTEEDVLTQFVFEHLSVRGGLTRLDTSWQTVLARRFYPPAVARLLGEALAACALLHANLKDSSRLSLQLQNDTNAHADAELQLLLAQIDGRGRLRGTARWRPELEQRAVDDAAALGTGARVTLTLEPASGRERYQGVVEWAGDSLSAALEHYFARSEQLPTVLRLAAGRHLAAGFMLQQLPAESATGSASLRCDDPDGWNRVSRLGATVSAAELLQPHTPERLLRRVFAEDDLRLFDARPLTFYCSCSRRRTANMLIGLGRDEVQQIITERGAVDVSCEFCGQGYRFDAVDAERLFGPPQPDLPPTTH